MKNTLYALLFALPIVAQEPIPIDDHVGLRIVPKGAGVAAALRDRMEVKKDGPIHRVLRDSSGKIVFAYDIEVKLKDGIYRILTGPVNPTYARTLQTEPVPTLNATHNSGTVAGGSVMIELLSNPATGQKVSDDIMLVDISAVGAPPDGNLTIWNADLWLNGTKVTPHSMEGGVINPRPAIYFQGIGGFFFSRLQPTEYPQFQKIGFVDGKVLKFVWGTQTFELRSTVPILSNGGSSDVWVFHDSQFRPKGDYDPKMSWGGAEAMKGWLGKEDEEN